MTHITNEEYMDMQRRMQILQDSIDKSTPDAPESELSKTIRQWAKDKAYPCLVHPQNKKLSWFVPEGYPDVVLSLPKGRTIYLELKSKKGIWKNKQIDHALMLGQLGHEYYVVRTFKRFLEIVDK